MVLGSGAREHAIIKSLSKSKYEKKLFCIGSGHNPGIYKLCQHYTIGDYNDSNFVVNYAKEHNIKMVIIGPENPLEMGIADALLTSGVEVIGPRKELAMIESSKTFTRDLQKEFHIPGGPKYCSFSNMNGVEDYIGDFGDDFVIKYDGLAGGKGVKVFGEHIHSKSDGLSFCKDIISEGGSFLIEEKFIGEEFSLMSFCDGKNIKHMPVVQDHKRAFDGDVGPNTGGMGAYSPAPLITEELNEEIMKDIIHPTLAELKRRNIDYKGFLYAGLMINEQKIKVLEYNCRFGDPETQPILMRMKSDFLSLCLKAAKQELKGVQIDWDDRFALGVVMASKGYPEKYETGFPISGLNGENETTKVFHCGTKIEGEKILSNGGRVLCVTGLGGNLDTAFKNAYETTSKISWDGAFYRKDIGKRNQ